MLLFCTNQTGPMQRHLLDNSLQLVFAEHFATVCSLLISALKKRKHNLSKKRSCSVHILFSKARSRGPLPSQCKSEAKIVLYQCWATTLQACCFTNSVHKHQDSLWKSCFEQNDTARQQEWVYNTGFKIQCLSRGVYFSHK